MSERPEITELLRRLSEGQRDALDRLVPIVYDELRSIAHARLRDERAGHTLGTTALVHEAYLKLIDVREMKWRDRAHFFAMAGRIMRRILVDYARARKRKKRGGDAVRITLTEPLAGHVEQSEDFLDLDRALSRFESLHERPSRVVECRCYAGLSLKETAAALEVSLATVKRDWAFARAWLNRELSGARTDTAKT